MFEAWVTVLISGLAMGAIYALVAGGLNLTWGVMNVVNMAHGVFLMLGAYITFMAWSYWGINPLFTIFLSFPILFALGALINRFLVRRTIGLASMLLTFGIFMVIENLTVVGFGGMYRSVRFFTGSYDLMGIFVSKPRIIAAGIAVAMSLLTYWFLKKTKIGVAIRAISLDRMMAEQCGVNTNQICTITFGIGAAQPAVAGSLMSLIFAFNPMLGRVFLVKAFAIVVLGGMGNFLGALIGGLTIGVVEAVIAFSGNLHLSEAAGFIIIILILLLRPSGIMGTRQ